MNFATVANRVVALKNCPSFGQSTGNLTLAFFNVNQPVTRRGNLLLSKFDGFQKCVVNGGRADLHGCTLQCAMCAAVFSLDTFFQMKIIYPLFDAVPSQCILREDALNLL